MDDWISTAEASHLSDYNNQHVRRLARNQEIIARKWGKDWMISKSSLLAYLKKKGHGPQRKRS